ncbi:MAG: helix-turn-helix transcriptional regulator [bacterium]|nr:helix-turn-helix transcriptional regulator [bacterium]
MSASRANEKFGQAVRGRRRALGLTQAQTCDLAGVGLAFLYELERGKPTVRLDKVLQVLQVLGLGLQLGDFKGALSVGLSSEELEQ